MMHRPRLSAPAANGAILAVPALDEAEGVISRNRALLAEWQHDFQGRSAVRLRAMTRDAVLRAAQDHVRLAPLTTHHSPLTRPATHHSPLTSATPFILTGHQPELFHPGVWLKNFAAHALGRRTGGVALHVVVDNDTVKRTGVRVPTGTPSQPSVAHEPLDRWQGEIPFEEYDVADERLFASFGDRLVADMRPLGIEPLAATFWPLAIAAARQTKRLSERLAAARRRQEQAWGCDSLELPVSRLCQTEGFHWFASHVLAQLAKFRDDYNRALDEYRRRNRIRSRNHPVPALGQDGDWLEAPFWIWSTDRPRRQRLFARSRGRELELTDRDRWTARLPLAPDREACCAVETLAEWAGLGIKIRTRALTTTMFTRLCLGDLFIHGLGGARYDEIADEVIRRFFRVEPPVFLTLTGTLHLPIPPRDASVADARALERLLRDLTYNPDRHLDAQAAASGDWAELVAAKWQAIRSQPASRQERRARFERIRQLNQSLSQTTGEARAAAHERLARTRTELAANAVIRDREWPFCVYPEATLRSFLGSAVDLSKGEKRSATEAS